MEQVLARLASLGRKLFVGANDRVANRTLRLAFERTCDILAPGGEAIGDATIL
jgi:hypothetical protein